MKQPKSALAKLLPRGAMKEIAKQLNLSGAAVTAALQSARPGHPAVAEAVRRIQQSGALNTAQVLNSMSG